MRDNLRLVRPEFNSAQQMSCTVKSVERPCGVHFHDFYEIELILEGSGKTILNGKEYTVLPNMAVLLSPIDFHEYEPSPAFTMLNVQFGTHVLRDLELPFSGFPICFLDDGDAALLRETLELIGSANDGDTKKYVYTKKLLEAAVAFVLPHMKKSTVNESFPSSVANAVVYINMHFKENPSLEEVAHAVFLEKNYFCSIFRKHIGKNYKSYLRELKLGYAMRLLKYTDLSVTEIALESGYYSMPHFYREFRAVHGSSPSEFRKKSENKKQP